MGDTVEYWKQQYEEAKAELDEFKETSQEYEKELETELGTQTNSLVVFDACIILTLFVYGL
jgi:hypothetical protein